MRCKDTVKRLLAVSTLLVFAGFSGSSSSAQEVDLGTEFIVFVDGINVLVPGFDGALVPEAGDPLNTVAEFGYGDGWAAPAFKWSDASGADMSAMVGPSVESGGQSMYLRLKVDPANAGVAPCDPVTGDNCLSITIFDTFDGAGADDNREGRLKWFIPDALRDGEWHDIVAPLPPDNVSALDSALVGKKVDGTPLDTPLDPMGMNWKYTGGWTAAVGGWGGTGGSPSGTNDPLWQDFEWDNVRGFAVHYDHASGGGNVQIDDFYFGDETTDISITGNPPAAMSGVTFSADGPENVISWTHNPDFGGYRVYLSEVPITSEMIESGDLAIFAGVPFNAPAFEVRHAYEAPNAGFGTVPLYYAVTSTNQFGIENTSVATSGGSITNPNLNLQAQIGEIDMASADLIFANLGAGIVSSDGFNTAAGSFNVDATHSKSGEGPLPADDADLSGRFWVSFNRDYNELYIYGEIMDDVVGLGPEGTVGSDAWQYDSIEMGWGAYDVRSIEGGSILNGSSHDSFMRGAYPDYQLRISQFGDNVAMDPSHASTFITTQSGVEGELQGGGSVFEATTDGYKFLMLAPFASFAAGTGDALTPIPDPDDALLMPFNIAINDCDTAPGGASCRVKQLSWSTRPTANNQWWNTPSQWLVVSMTGSQFTGVSNEDVTSSLPTEYVLDQNYPNPFNPSTTIDFSLPATETVTLTVYNVLGQKVATLIADEAMSAGTHSVQFDATQLSSGMYLYRLEAGKAFSRTMPMMLLK